MGSLSIWHWLVVVVVVLLLFGRGKISELMGDMAQGIKAFKKGMADDTEAKAEPAKEAPKTIEHQPPGTSSPSMNQRAETERRVEGSTI
ncbi:MAG TPA: twin-arginine translocase TatA/TatE family subunit [Xanthobacteraceae bacterium]|nr:twin-arginine translocase TatA/TatE family subunit [Xanthobacteraceae bacterium]